MSAPLLRLGFVTSSGWLEPGGVQTVTRALAGELSRRGHAVSALVLDPSSERPDGSELDERVEGVAVRRVAWKYESQRTLAELARTPLLEEAAARWSAAEGLDLVHLHHLSGWGLGVPPRLAELGLPVLWTLHDYWSVCPRGQLFHREGRCCEEVRPELCAGCITATWPKLASSGDPVRDVEQRLAAARRAFAACARLYTPSAAARAVLLRAGVEPSPLVVCENGIEPVASPAAPRRPAEQGELRIGVLGSVQPSKGVLELARLVVELGAPFSLTVHGPRESYHGDRSCLDALEALAARAPALRLAGPYVPRQLGEILAGLQLVCVPSLWPETHGLVAREARAAGVPVFASRLGGLDHPAFHLLPPGDPAAWRTALERFAADSAWRAELAGAPFAPRSIQAMGEVLERDYRELGA